MATLLDLLRILLPLVYLVAGIAYGRKFFASRPQVGGAVGTAWLASGLLLHLLWLAGLTWRFRQLPVATPGQILSAIAFVVGLVYLLVEWRSRNRSTGLWIVAPIFLFQLLASLLWSSQPPDLSIFRSPLFATHVVLALVGYVAFTLAAAYGFLFLRLYGELKQHRFRTFFGRLPALETLEQMMGSSILIGFLGLSGAVIAGAAWAQVRSLGDWLTDAWTLTTLGLWGLYAATLLLRRLRRWRGRQTAAVSLVGIALIVATLVAVNLSPGGFHHFR